MYNRLLQTVSYIINRQSNLPLLSRFHLYDTMRDYLLDQEFRIKSLETRVKSLEDKVTPTIQPQLTTLKDCNKCNKLEKVEKS